MSWIGSERSSVVEVDLNRRLATGGFRFTPQRRHVYQVMLDRRDHPTAEEVFIRAKQAMPDISMATVYNCLDALVKCGLVRQVNLDRTAARYCPNMKEHCHFYCDTCGQVYDVALEGQAHVTAAKIPEGFRVNRYEIVILGVCPTCGHREANGGG